MGSYEAGERKLDHSHPCGGSLVVPGGGELDGIDEGDKEDLLAENEEIATELRKLLAGWELDGSWG